MIVDQILELFRANEKFLISSHQHLEGDALGSQLALGYLLKAMGKTTILVSPEKLPEIYNFLPGFSSIICNPIPEKVDYDVACFVDCTGFDRMGPVEKLLDTGKPLVNIDHHVSNANYGIINWVDPNYSSAGELVYELYKGANVVIDEAAATCLYVAILTDTGSFRYSNTTARTHTIVAELIFSGIDPTSIYRLVYERIERSRVELLGSVLSTLKLTRDGSVAWIEITRGMLDRHKATFEGTEDFVNFPRGINGVKVALAFREVEKNVVKVSFRSNDIVNVNRLAKLFGGGGHRSASGCTLQCSLAEAEEVVITESARFAQSEDSRE